MSSYSNWPKTHVQSEYMSLTLHIKKFLNLELRVGYLDFVAKLLLPFFCIVSFAI